jgi:alkanesulfonate monooxygenase SsuD/methylene tetrahydromethanopterin reductase-like flavin-dependent oxidoreductase (luciferase family)
VKVGFVLPLARPEGRGPRWEDIRRLTVDGEAAGFDSIWVFDHLMIHHGDDEPMGLWEAWTIQSAVAAITSRVELGQIVLCTAFRDPSWMAIAAATAEEISGGRLILGLGCGWHEPEFEAYGFPFDHRVGRFEESLQITRGLLRDGRADQAGRWETARDARLFLPQPRPGGPPLLIASKGERMMRLTARYADSWNAAWMPFPNDRFRERRDNLLVACEAEGRDPATLEQTAGLAIRYPSEEGTADAPRDPERELGGEPDELAAAFRAWEELGIGHVICTSPETSDDLAWLAEGLRLYRD